MTNTIELNRSGLIVIYYLKNENRFQAAKSIS